jgi:enoyl-CoA hydratase/carnithine racemase
MAQAVVTAGQFDGDLAATGSRSSIRPELGLRIEDQGKTRSVVLDRRGKQNAITLAMYQALTRSLEEAANTDAIHVVLLSSAGGAFSVGSDLSTIVTGEAGDAECEAFARGTRDFLRTLASFPKPIVAAVNGLAVGVGATLLLHCDFVVASQFAAFEFSFAQLAMTPDAASSVLLGERIGLQRASEWLFLGERIKADTLLRFGLVNAIVPLEELLTTARARADALAALPQAAVRETKRLLREPLRAMVEDAIAGDTPSLKNSLLRLRRSVPPPF